MIFVEKEILTPGEVFDPKTQQWYTFTDEDVRTGARNLSIMFEKGRRPPAVWEHQNVEVGDPDEWKANYAKYTFGYLGPGRVSTLADVRKGIASRVGTLIARHDVFDKKDARQLKRLKVSPKLYRGYRDSDGTEYSGCVPVHSAATPSPCQFQQAPFKFDIELSSATAFFVSYASDVTPSAPSCPLHDWRNRGITLSTTKPERRPMADETEDTGKKKKDDSEGGVNAEVEAVIKALRAKGLVISDKVKTLNDLVIAVESNTAVDDDEMDDEDSEIDDETPMDPTTAPASGSPPMLMSTTDPGEKGKRAEREVKADRTEASKMVDAALHAGKINGIDARRLHRIFGHCELSVTETGAVTGPRWNAAIEELNKINQRPKNWVLTNGTVDLSVTNTTSGGDAPAELVNKNGRESTPERDTHLGEWIAGKRSDAPKN